MIEFRLRHDHTASGCKFQRQPDILAGKCDREADVVRSLIQIKPLAIGENRSGSRRIFHDLIGLFFWDAGCSSQGKGF